ncbi:hypothetical protein LTS18_006485, partial [Coniosporium uncinatum]
SWTVPGESYSRTMRKGQRREREGQWERWLRMRSSMRMLQEKKSMTDIWLSKTTVTTLRKAHRHRRDQLEVRERDKGHWMAWSRGRKN